MLANEHNSCSLTVYSYVFEWVVSIINCIWLCNFNSSVSSIEISKKVNAWKVESVCSCVKFNSSAPPNLLIPSKRVVCVLYFVNLSFILFDIDPVCWNYEFCDPSWYFKEVFVRKVKSLAVIAVSCRYRALIENQ